MQICLVIISVIIVTAFVTATVMKFRQRSLNQCKEHVMKEIANTENSELMSLLGRLTDTARKDYFGILFTSLREIQVAESYQELSTSVDMMTDRVDRWLLRNEQNESEDSSPMPSDENKEIQ